MEYTKPKYILFAGVNGCGKSTLYRLRPEYQILPRINTDEIVREYGDWKDTSNQMKAGKKAVKLIKSHFEKFETFNQETTLCGKSILKNIEYALKQGYCVEMHYIGVESVEICKERIRKRVLLGGHGIADEDVERRYFESLSNMKKILPLCDKVYFYNNTENFELIAVSNKGIMNIRCSQVPNWFNKII